MTWVFMMKTIEVHRVNWLGAKAAFDCASHSHGISFLVNFTKWCALCAKFLIKILRTPTVPKKDLTSDLLAHTVQSLIGAILDLSAILPSLVQQCPTTQNFSTHRSNFFPENVPPQYFMRCTILFTFWKCSQTNFLIPGFSGKVSYDPSSNKYLDTGPFTGTSSM